MVWTERVYVSTTARCDECESLTCDVEFGRLVVGSLGFCFESIEEGITVQLQHLVDLVQRLHGNDVCDTLREFLLTGLGELVECSIVKGVELDDVVLQECLAVLTEEFEGERGGSHNLLRRI